VYPRLPAEQGRYAVFGSFAFNTYNRPRETQDIDLAIVFKEIFRLAAEIEADPAFGVRVKRYLNQIIILADNSKIADLVTAEADPVLKAALADTRGTRRAHVPRLGEAWVIAPEVLVAGKYSAATDPGRKPDRRLQDAADLTATLTGPTAVDLDLVRHFVSLIRLPRAAELFERDLQRIQAGKIPRMLFGALDE
jgi:hypothetical protein